MKQMKCNFFFKNCILKEKYGKVIIRNDLFIYLFILCVWMMTKGNLQVVSFLFCYKSHVNVFNLSTK